MKIRAVLMLSVMCVTVWAQTKPDTWTLFAKTRFEPKYFEKLGEYIFYPTFSDELRATEGKEVTLEGYYVPFAPENGNYIILSKYPMSQCYFCGGGGPETIAEVHFTGAISKFKVDDLVTVKGKLKLNADDPDHVNFLLTAATVVKK